MKCYFAKKDKKMEKDEKIFNAFYIKILYFVELKGLFYI